MRRGVGLAGLVLLGGLARARSAQAQQEPLLHPLLVDGVLSQDPKSSVALCEGDSFYNCRVVCGGTLVAPNLVVTSRHCADVAQLDSLDCSTYRFSGTLEPATTLWITAASPVSNDASFHQGLRWDIPLAIGCGHDLAFLTLQDSVASGEATPVAPATAPDAVRALGSASLDLYGYGKTGPDAPIDPERRHASASVLCIGGVDSCKTIPGGGDLETEEFAVDAQVCPGDSGSGVFSPSGDLLGSLARSIGGSSVCAYGVYTRLSPHGLLFARTATHAAGLGGYPVPSWVPALESAGNTPALAPRAFGASCDGDADCDSGACRSYDGALAWSCVRPCAEGCSVACRTVPDGSFCFSEPAPPAHGGCVVSPTMAEIEFGYPAAGLLFLTWSLVRRARRR